MEETAQQLALRDAAEDLLKLLRETVPDTTVHFAVEQVRGPLRRLAAEAHRVITADVDVEEYYAAQARAAGSV